MAMEKKEGSDGGFLEPVKGFGARTRQCEEKRKKIKSDVSA